MNIIIKGDLDKGYFQERVVEVLDKIEGEENIDFSLIIIGDNKFCGEASRELPKVDSKTFERICKEIMVSTSFRADNKEYIVIKADKEFLLENKSAARGLIAHEIMHTILRERGVNRMISENATEIVRKLAGRLAGIGINKKDAINFSVEVIQVAVLTLKDLVANRELLEQNLYDDLLEYYFCVLDLEKYFPAPEFYSRKPSLEEVKKAILFQLYLMPAWLPFVVCDEKRCSIINEKIQEKYNKHLKHTAYHIGKVQEVYEKFHNNSTELAKNFYSVLIESVFKIIEEKLIQN